MCCIYKNGQIFFPFYINAYIHPSYVYAYAYIYKREREAFH